VQGGAGLNFAGADKKFQLAQDSNKYYWISSVRKNEWYVYCLLQLTILLEELCRHIKFYNGSLSSVYCMQNVVFIVVNLFQNCLS